MSQAGLRRTVGSTGVSVVDEWDSFPNLSGNRIAYRRKSISKQDWCGMTGSSWRPDVWV